MSKMSELYQKVASDVALQEKWIGIQKAAENQKPEETMAALIAFSREAGFEVSMEEATAYFADMANGQQEGTLSDAELDMVAGGKSNGGNILFGVTSVASVGIGCGVTSVLAVAMDYSSCGDYFETLAKS